MVSRAHPPRPSHPEFMPFNMHHALGSTLAPPRNWPTFTGYCLLALLRFPRNQTTPKRVVHQDSNPRTTVNLDIEVPDMRCEPSRGGVRLFNSVNTQGGETRATILLPPTTTVPYHRNGVYQKHEFVRTDTADKCGLLYWLYWCMTYACGVQVYVVLGVPYEHTGSSYHGHVSKGAERKKRATVRVTQRYFSKIVAQTAEGKGKGKTDKGNGFSSYDQRKDRSTCASSTAVNSTKHNPTRSSLTTHAPDTGSILWTRALNNTSSSTGVPMLMTPSKYSKHGVGQNFPLACH